MGRRHSGLLELTEGIRASIAIVLATEQWRATLGKSTDVPDRDYVLSLRDVIAVEDALGVQLPDSVLALMASASDTLVEMWTLKLGAACEHAELGRECGLPPTLVAVGQLEHEFLCFEREDSAVHGDVWLTLWSQRDGSSHRVKLSEWVEGHVDHIVDDLDFGRAELDLIEEPENLARFRVRLVDEDARDHGPQIAVHARFGRGRVVRWLEGGAKVEVDFEHGGRKVLLARFVELSEPTP